MFLGPELNSFSDLEPLRWKCAEWLDNCGQPGTRMQTMMVEKRYLCLCLLSSKQLSSHLFLYVLL